MPVLVLEEPMTTTNEDDHESFYGLPPQSGMRPKTMPYLS
jgi:hypothetical protein